MLFIFYLLYFTLHSPQVIDELKRHHQSLTIETKPVSFYLKLTLSGLTSYIFHYFVHIMTIITFFFVILWPGLGKAGKGRTWEGCGVAQGADSSGEVGAAGSALWPQNHYETSLAQWEPETCITGRDLRGVGRVHTVWNCDSVWECIASTSTNLTLWYSCTINMLLQVKTYLWITKRVPHLTACKKKITCDILVWLESSSSFYIRNPISFFLLLTRRHLERTIPLVFSLYFIY